MTIDPAAPSAAASHVVLVAADDGDASVAAAEHLAHHIVEALDWDSAAGALISTHILRRDVAHVAAVCASSPDPARGAAELLATLAATFPEVGFTVQADADAALGSTGPAALSDAAGIALVEHRDRAAGRLVDYPGRTAIECLTTPAEVTASSCIDAVEGLVGLDVRPDSQLDLTGFARPQWRQGRCVLLVQQGSRALVPFEVRDQIPCCSHH